MNDVEPECPVVGGEKHIFAHDALERFSIDAVGIPRYRRLYERIAA